MRDIWPVGLTRDRGEALFEMARREKSRRLLEIGLGLGFSTSFLIEAALLNSGDAESIERAPMVTSIDPCESSLSGNAGLVHIAQAGASAMHTHINEPSQIAMPRMVDLGERFDLVFVDGDHKFDGTFVDVYFSIQLAPGGLVVLDDAWMPSVAKASRFFTSNGVCELEEVFESGGKHRLHALRVLSPRPERAWDHFVDF